MSTGKQEPHLSFLCSSEPEDASVTMKNEDITQVSYKNLKDTLEIGPEPFNNYENHEIDYLSNAFENNKDYTPETRKELFLKIIQKNGALILFILWILTIILFGLCNWHMDEKINNLTRTKINQESTTKEGNLSTNSTATLSHMEDENEFTNATFSEYLESSNDSQKSGQSNLTEKINIPWSYHPKVELGNEDKFKPSYEMTRIKELQKQSMDALYDLRGPKNGVLIWKIDEFSKKKKAALNSVMGIMDYFSNDFYSSEYGYKMSVNIEFRKDRLGVYMLAVSGENDAFLPPIFLHRRTYSILDQSNRKNKRDIVQTIEPSFRDRIAEDWMSRDTWHGMTDFCQYSLLENKFKDVYLKNDTIFLKVVVDPIAHFWSNPVSRDGILVWNLLDYNRTKQESIDRIKIDSISESFYSSSRGYRMQCALNFTEHHMIFFTMFRRGEFDDSLPDVYAHIVTVSMVDRNSTNDESSLRTSSTLSPIEIGLKKAKERMSHWGTAIPYTLFEKRPFLIDDSILIKVTVKSI